MGWPLNSSKSFSSLNSFHDEVKHAFRQIQTVQSAVIVYMEESNMCESLLWHCWPKVGFQASKSGKRTFTTGNAFSGIILMPCMMY